MENISKICQVKEKRRYKKLWYNIWKGMIFHFFTRGSLYTKGRGGDGESRVGRGGGKIKEK